MVRSPACEIMIFYIVCISVTDLYIKEALRGHIILEFFRKANRHFPGLYDANLNRARDYALHTYVNDY